MSDERTTVDAWALLGSIYGQIIAIHGLDEAERKIRRFNDFFWQTARRMADDTRVTFIGKAIEDIAKSAVQAQEEETKP